MLVKGGAAGREMTIPESCKYHGGVTWASCLKPPTTGLFVQQFVEASNNENRIENPPVTGVSHDMGPVMEKCHVKSC